MSDTNNPGEEADISPAVQAPTSEEAVAPKTETPTTTEKVDATEGAQADSAAKDTSDAKAAVIEPATEATKSEESSKDQATNGDSKNTSEGTSEKKHDRSGKRDEYSGGRRYDRDHRGEDRGRHDRYDRNKRKFNKNRNNEFENLPESDDPVEIREQVEFYFRSSNLRTDDHMFFESEGPFNKPVGIKHLCTFKRMRRFQPYSAVVNALRESKSLEVVDSGEYQGLGKEAVKRKEAIVVNKAQGEEMKNHSIADLFHMYRKQPHEDSWYNSIYAKGFGEEEKADQIALEKFFKPYGSVEVRKRKDADGKWKDSVFVEFETLDAQKEFLNLDPKPKFNGNELLIKSKMQYHEEKCKEKGIDPYPEPKSREGRDGGNHRGRGGFGRGRGGGRGRGRGRGRGGHGHRDDRRNRDRSGSPGSDDSRDWSGRRDKFQKSRDFKDHKKGDRDSDRRSSKRKADDSDREDSPKRNKVEIKEDA